MPPERGPLLIYGGGGFAREVAWLAETCQFEPVAFIDDAVEHPEMLNGLPVLSLGQAGQQFPGAAIAAGIGNPKARQTVTGKARAAGFRPVTLVHPRVEMSRFVSSGPGCIVCGNSIVTTNIALGEGVHLHIGCSVSHDSILGDFVTLAPGAHVSGNVHLSARVYVGTGAVIINGTPAAPLVIGEDTVIGAGACVTKSFGAGLTIAGVPAKVLERKVAAHGT